MIGKFWDALFDYADEAKANGDMTRYEICHEIEDLLQKAYDDGMSNSNVIKSHKPKGKVEELVMSIPDIKVYKDKTDGQIWYELDCEYGEGHERFRYDTPEEVIMRLIDYRTNKINSNMGEEKKLLLLYISKRLDELRCVEDVLKQNGTKRIIYVEAPKEIQEESK